MNSNIPEIPEGAIRRILPGCSVKVKGQFGGVIERRDGLSVDEKRRPYTISCAVHKYERRRYARTLKLAVGIAGDTSLWCRDCAVLHPSHPKYVAPKTVVTLEVPAEVAEKLAAMTPEDLAALSNQLGYPVLSITRKDKE